MRGPFSKRWMVIAISLGVGAVFALQRPRRGVGCENCPPPYGTSAAENSRGLRRGCVVRNMTGVLVALLLGGAAIETASAQASYPSRPIRVVVPFGPGGFADITVRLVGQKLAERTGQQVVIENRPSAGGIIAANAVTSAQPDGYTLFVFSSGIALSKALLKTLPFDPATAF